MQQRRHLLLRLQCGVVFAPCLHSSDGVEGVKPLFSSRCVDVLLSLVKALTRRQFRPESSSFRFQYDSFVHAVVGGGDRVDNAFSYKNRFYHVLYLDCEVSDRLLEGISLFERRAFLDEHLYREIQPNSVIVLRGVSLWKYGKRIQTVLDGLGVGVAWRADEKTSFDGLFVVKSPDALSSAEFASLPSAKSEPETVNYRVPCCRRC